MENNESGNSPRSVTIARKGIYTAQDFCNVMSALMVDLLEGRVTPQVGQATANTSGKLLKACELQHKYGVDGGGNKKTLTLADKKAFDALPSE